MKRGCASGSSSCNSNSCIGGATELKKNKSDVNKPKRVRAKKLVPKVDTSDNSAVDASSPKSRSSAYRGVTRHRWTGRYEAHLWDKTTWNNIQTKRGRQIYLGAYDDELDAARTYDLAALKYWGSSTTLNLPAECYAKEIEEMEKVPRDEYIASLRRRSNGFSRGVSKYRGVARHHHNGRWEARIGRVSGNKYLYLGTYSTQEEAAEAYDKAAIKYRGANAITNFNINNYIDSLGNLVPDFEEKQEVAREKEEPNPEPLISVQVDDHQKDEIRPESYPMTIMDPTEDHEYPWGLCLDTGFNPLPLQDTPLDKASELLDWLDHKAFKDDDIACIFDFENEFTLEDAMSGTSGCKGEANARVVEDLKENDLSTSHSSSSLSTMASVSSNI